MKHLNSLINFKQILFASVLGASIGIQPVLAADVPVQITASKNRVAGSAEATVNARRVEMDKARVIARQTATNNGAASAEAEKAAGTTPGVQKLQKREAFVSHARVDSAAVTLDVDYDGDGYYTQISVDFDVDTEFLAADVYARLYLSLELGPWVEYAVTDDFVVLGASGSDGYFIETDLVEGFLPGYYDLRIEVFDAYDDALLASFDADDSSALALMPLEDELADDVEVVTVYESESVVTYSSGGGGSAGPLLLLGLGLLGTMRRYSGRYSDGG